MSRSLPYADMDKILSLSKRRGFVFQSSEIYGGLGSTWDYGPLGVELKRNVKEAWWQSVISGRDDMVGLDAAILMHPKTWEASGHVENFSDPLVECRECNQRFREDHLAELTHESGWWLSLRATLGEPFTSTPRRTSTQKDCIDAIIRWIEIAGEDYGPRLALVQNYKKYKEIAIEDDHETLYGEAYIAPAVIGVSLAVMQVANLPNPYGDDRGMNNIFKAVGMGSFPCPEYGCGGEFTAPRRFNLMFRTFMGPVEDTAHEVWLRPETAQGIFVNFKNVVDSTRRKVPFGIGQIGKSFRNEITPGNFTFRTREFEQMEVEFFVRPGTDVEWLDRWVKDRFRWYVDLGIRPENLRLRRHGPDELAHYAKDCYDIEYRFPWGWAELEGIADRTDFDLKQHAEFSGEDLSYFDDSVSPAERYYPYVIEPSGGVDRATLAFWLDAYDEEPDGNSVRVVSRIHRRLAPITVAVLPLSRNERLTPTARRVQDLLRPHFAAQYDDAQSIGRRYRRQDEIGTPYCVTVDFDTLDDRQVTVRDRDTMYQARVPIARLVDILRDKLEHGW